MGLPQIIIEFKASGASAISRSARGQVLLVLKDSVFSAVRTYTALSDVDKSDFSPESYECIRLCFLGVPARVSVLARSQGGQAVESELLFEHIRNIKYNWLCAPALDNAELVSFIKSERQGRKAAKAVLANAASPDCEGIVNLCALDLKLESGDVSAVDYACRIAGTLAGLSLAQSATFYPLPELISAAPHLSPDEEIDSGRLILTSSQNGYRISRAVTSLTGVTADKGSEFKKIKIVEAVDLMRQDIANAFEGQYVGKVINDYDSKLLLVTAIDGYLASLSGEVLDGSYENTAFVSLDMQKRHLQQQGIDTAEMSDTEILKANTGSKVFLAARVRFADAMEDLTFGVSM